MREERACSYCGRTHRMDELCEFDGHMFCPECLERYTVLCRDCGERIWRGDDQGSGEIHLCRDCYDDRYTHCHRCGALLHESEAYYEDSDEFDERPYCRSCFEERNDDPIHNYYYKPEPIFCGDGPRYFGVELEIDEGGEVKSKARSLLEVANREGEYLYIKHDGSLDDGLELVTYPMSLDFQLHHVPWTELCRKAVELGYISHQASTCGLHVHVSRAAFGETEVQQDAAIARVLCFFEKHWEELLKFSRRTPRQLERWAARYGYKEQPKEILDFAKKGGSQGRYVCVNLQNQDTVEFRMFRGTLKPNTIFATLQLLNRICDVAVFLSDEEMQAMAWTTFVSGCTQPELVQYLKERRLYVNEPVESEAEQ